MMMKSFGLDPEKIKAEVTKATGVVNEKLSSIDARLLRIETALSIILATLGDDETTTDTHRMELTDGRHNGNNNTHGGDGTRSN